MPQRNELNLAETDTRYMRRALELAGGYRGFVEPNPLVGAVVVRDGQVVGEGAHQAYGGPHAEVHALLAAGELARGATLYVTLEPCNHYGKTPPCTKAVIEAGVSRVVVAMLDPNPLMQGRSVEMLRSHGIAVTVGVCQEQARQQNRVFLTNMTERRASLSMKAAVSLDGRLALANGRSAWITGSQARQHTHRLRGEHQAVLCGVGTVLADDPALNCRAERDSGQPPYRQPVRIVLDPELRTPPEALLFRTEPAGPVWLVGNSLPQAHHPLQELSAQLNGRLRFLCAPTDSAGKWDLPALLGMFWQEGVAAILVEGGAKTHAQFLKAGLYDRLLLFVAPVLLGQDGHPLWAADGPSSMEQAPRFLPPEWLPPTWTQLGPDVLFETSRVPQTSPSSPTE